MRIASLFFIPIKSFFKSSNYGTNTVGGGECVKTGQLNSMVLATPSIISTLIFQVRERTCDSEVYTAIKHIPPQIPGS